MPNTLPIAANNTTDPYSPGPGINAPTANDIPNVTIAPNNTTRQYSPAAGVNEIHPVGIEAGANAPGLGVATSSTVEVGIPSVSDPNSIKASNNKPGLGEEKDGTVEVGPASQTAEPRIDGGLLSPSRVPVDIVDANRIADQNLVYPFPQNVILGAPTVR
jgi:hypothetical protein